MKTFYTTLLLIGFLSFQLSAQWSTLSLPTTINQAYGTSSSTKIFIPGGFQGFLELDNMFVYDIAADEWESVVIGRGRSKIASVANDSLVFCAGGISFFTGEMFDEVEIFNATTNELVGAGNLSSKRVELSAAIVNDKVLFAGGMYAYFAPPVVSLDTIYANVDIYDIATDTWELAMLSEARAGMAHAVLGDKVYFAGGYKGNGEASNRVDIYDAATGTWTIDSISVARAFYGGGVAFDGKVYFAGGLLEDNSSSDIIDVYDPNTDTWSVEYLSVPRCGVQAGTTNNYLIFAGGGEANLAGWFFMTTSNQVDIYNKADDSWDTYAMTNGRINFIMASANNQVFMLGGLDALSGDLSSGDVFTDMTPTSTESVLRKAEALNVYPNPTTEYITVNNPIGFQPEEAIVEVISATGQMMAVDKSYPANQLMIHTASLPVGLYVLRVTDQRQRWVGSFVKN